MSKPWGTPDQALDYMPYALVRHGWNSMKPYENSMQVTGKTTVDSITKLWYQWWQRPAPWILKGGKWEEIYVTVLIKEDK